MNDAEREKEKKKAKRSKSILIIGLFTLLTVGSWVTFDVYRALVKTTIPNVLQKQTQPLTSKIDPDIMTNLKSRRQFTDSELNSVHPNPTLLNNLSPTPRVATSGATTRPRTATGSAAIIPAQESTQSASGSL